MKKVTKVTALCSMRASAFPREGVRTELRAHLTPEGHLEEGPLVTTWALESGTEIVVEGGGGLVPAGVKATEVVFLPNDEEAMYNILFEFAPPIPSSRAGERARWFLENLVATNPSHPVVVEFSEGGPSSLRFERFDEEPILGVYALEGIWGDLGPLEEVLEEAKEEVLTAPEGAKRGLAALKVLQKAGFFPSRTEVSEAVKRLEERHGA